MAISFSGWSVARLKQYIRDMIRREAVLSQQTPITQVVMVSENTYVLYDNTEVSGDLTIQAGSTAIVKTSWPE